MPNYTINEVIIHDVNQRQQAEILAKVNGAWGPIDFSTLLPVPINYWHGSAGRMHEYVFPGIALDWCTQNWSTKRNAVPGFWGKDEPQRYLPIAQTNTSLTLTFQTAWSPPCGWVVALFNTFHFKMSHNWLGEEDNVGYTDRYFFDGMGWNEWSRMPAGEELQRHLMYLRYGVESFDSDDDEALTLLDKAVQV